jgi:hypothetical protein
LYVPSFATRSVPASLLCNVLIFPTASFSAIDVSQKGPLSSVQLTGTFNSTDPTQPNPLTEGTFTFVDSSSTDAKIVCDRAADAPWYQQTIPDWYLFIIVPCFIIALGAWTKAKLRSNQVSYAASHLLKVRLLTSLFPTIRFDSFTSPL